MDYASMTSGEASIALAGYSAARQGVAYDPRQCEAWREGWRLWHLGTFRTGEGVALARATAPRVYRTR